MEYEIINICKIAYDSRKVLLERCIFIRNVLEEKFGGNWRVVEFNDDNGNIDICVLNGIWIKRDSSWIFIFNYAN